MSLAEIKAEDRRGAILRLLAADQRESASDSNIDRALDALGPALRATNAQVLVDFSWLEQAGLVTLVELDGYTVATLTQYGKEVAIGEATVPGVSRVRRPR